MVNEKSLMIVAVIAVIVSAVAMMVAVINAGNVNNWVLGLSPGNTTNQTYGTVNVTIVQNLVINFSSDKIIWGRGSVNAGETSAILDSAQSVTAVNGNWNRSVMTIGATPGEGDGATTPQGFVLQNIGNINAHLYLRTDKDATQFLGPSTNPVYQYNVSNAGGCAVANQTLSAPGYGSYFDVNTTNPGTKVCNQLGFASGSNSLRVDIRLVIPFDVPTSNTPRTSNMIATAQVA